MSAVVCTCGEIGLGNLGTPSCQEVFNVTRKLIFVPYFDSTGAQNFIDISTPPTFDQTFWNDNLYNVDKSKRWQLSPFIDNITDERDDAITETLDSGINLFIQEGSRNFSGIMVEQSTTFLGKLKRVGCSEVGVYILDKDNSLIGSMSQDETKLYPIRLEKATFYPRLVKTTDTTVQKVQLDFAYAQTEADECLRAIKGNKFTAKGLDQVSIIDANLKEDSNVTPSTSAIGVTVTMDYGGAIDRNPIVGLLAADFVVNDGTGTNTPDSVTETADGVYLFDFTSDPLASGTTSVTLADGKRFEEKATLEITIP